MAGNGVFGFSGDGGPATGAELSNPEGVTLDGAGNLYIADEGNERIRKVSTAGVISTVAGNGSCTFSGDNGPATSAALCSPQSVAVDGAGNLYVADTFNQRVRKVSTSGVITTVAGDGTCNFSGDNGPAAGAELCNPQGVAADGPGNLYIADSNNNRIRKVSTSGVITTYAGNGTAGFSGDGGPATSAELDSPRGLSLDNAGNLYFADNGNVRIRNVTPSGVINTTLPVSQFPNAVTIDNSGNLYVAEFNIVQKISTIGSLTNFAGNGTDSYSGDNGPGTSAQLFNPFGVAVDGAGNLYIADSENYRIRKVSTGGVITTIAGDGIGGYSGDNGPATSAELDFPKGVEVDGAGNLYIADTFSQRIRKVSTSGVITTVAGDGQPTYVGDNGPATSAQFYQPGATAVDGAGNLYIADTENSRIRKVSPAGVITTVAGNGTCSSSGDNGPATNAELCDPEGVALDGAGNLYIADSSNYRIRKVSTAGVITTVAGNGTCNFSGDNGPATSAELCQPGSVAVDGAGNLYIADTGNERIRKVSPAGVITTVAGNGSCNFSGDNGPATSAELCPQSVAVDSAGNLYIADSNNERIRKVSTGGVITTVAGNGFCCYGGDNGPATSAELDFPEGVAVDGAGNLYIADTGNSRIRRVSTSGVITTVAGNGTRGYSGDNGPATSAELDFPTSVAADSGGNLYVTDQGDGRIRKLTAGTPASLIVTKSHTGTFTQGQQNAAFTVTATNTGPITITNLAMTESIPTGLTLTSLASSVWSCSSNTCTLASLLPGAAGQISVKVAVAANAPTQVINQVSVSGDQITTTGATDTVTIVPACSYALASPSANVGAGASTGSVAISTGPSCAWSVPTSSLPGWITIGSGSGTGSGTITYGVAANGGGARSGSFTVVDGNGDFAASFTINQAANTTCTSVTVSPTSATFNASGTGTGTATVTLNPSTCGWSSISVTPPSATWISGFPTGPGTGQFTYTVAANPSTTSSRSATLNVVSNNQTLPVTITENAQTCIFTIANSATDPGTSAGYLSSGGSGSIVVNASPSSCTWTWMSTQSFVTPASGSGSGNGSIQYGVASNSTATAQTAFIALTGQGQTQSLYYAINEAGNQVQSYTATVSTGVPPILRSDGIAELAGDILVIESGSTTAGGVTGDVVVTFNTPISNHALSADPSGQTTDALLLLNEPSSLTLGTNVFRGAVAGPNAIRFRNVPLAPAVAGGFGTTLRITDARVDASHLGSGQTVTATVNFVAPVAFTFSGSSVASTSAPATVGNVVDDTIHFLAGSPSVGPGAGQTTYLVTFDEALTNSYRARVLSNQDPSQLGVPYNSESGFVNSAALGTETGFASNGTRLVLTISNVPPGVTAVYASLAPTAITPGAAARMVSADSNGIGGFPVESATTFGGLAYQQIPITAGTGSVTWEVTASSATQLDSLTFNVLAQGGTLPGNAFSAFIGPKQQVSAPSLTASVPRFLGNAAAAAAANLSLVPQGNMLSPTFSKVRFTPALNPDGSPTTGGSFSILETLTNNGSAATGIRVGGSLDPTTNATFTGCVADAGGNCSTIMNDASITFPSLTAGQSVNINLNAFVPDVAASPYVTVTSTVYSDQPNIGPSTFTEQIPVVNVGQPSLFINKVRGTASGCDAVSNGTLAQGQQSAVYTLTVCNQPGAAHTSGQITVTEVPDGNQTLVSMQGAQGSDWNCTTSLHTCTTTTVLNQGALPPITVNVNVSPTSASTVTNWAYVVGGGSVYTSSSMVNSPVVQGLPLVVSGVPPVATASPQVFTFTGRDNGGFANIAKIFFLVADTPDPIPNTCQGYYDTKSKALYLYNDDNKSVQGPLTPGTSGTLSNSQCSLAGTSSGVASASGTDLAVNFNLSLLGTYLVSNHKVYAYVTNNQGIGSGWVQTGTWGLGPSVVSGTPTAPTTTPQTFTFVGRDTGGYHNIERMYFLINTVKAVGPAMCQGFYDQTSNTFWLYGDPPPGGPLPLLGPLSPGSAQTLQNSECTLYGAPVNSSHAPPGPSGSATVSGLGTDLTMSVTLGLQGTFAAVPENVYLWVQNFQGQNTGWVQTGTWTIGQVPSVVSGTPAVAAATPQAFTFVGRDTGGYGNISQMSFLVSGSPVTGANTCWGYYAPASKGLYLYDDTGVTLLGPIAPGSSGVLQNSQCVLYGNTSSLVSGTGTDLTVNIGLGVIGSYATSPKNVYLQVSDNEGNSTAWVQTGTWNLVDMPSVVSGTPTNPTTTPQTFTFVGRDPGGYQNIQRLFFLINTSPMTTANVCHGYYDQPTNSLYLYNDALTVAMGPLKPGDPGTLQNSQCTLYGTLVSSSLTPPTDSAGASPALVSGAGTDLTLTVTMSLEGAFADVPENVYLWVKNLQGQNTGWVQTGAWNVGHVPSVVSGTPTSAVATPQTFTFTGGDTGGYQNIDRMYFLVNSSATVGQNVCHGFYDRAANGLYLYNDALTVLMGPLTPGSATTLQNSQCVVDGSSSALVSGSGADLTINVGIGLLGTYAGTPQKVYLWVKDNENSDTGWVQTGTWTVAARPSVVSGTPTAPIISPQTFAFTGRDTGGYQNIDRIYFLINSSPTPQTDTCQGYYIRSQNALYLYNDDNRSAQGPLKPGSSGTLQNSQCTVYGSTSSVPPAAGTDLTINVALALQGTLALAPQNVYLWVTDGQGNGTGWVQTGTWNIGHSVTALGSPAYSNTSPQVFTFIGRDTGGYANVTQMSFQVSNAPNPSPVSCQGYYLPVPNVLYLYNDTKTVILGPLAPGSPGTLSNSQCTVYGGTSSVSGAGTDLTLNVGLGSNVRSTQIVSLTVVDNEGSSASAQISVWNPNPTPSVVSGTPTSPSTTPQIFAFTGRDTGGYQNIKRIFFLVNTSPISPPHICQGYYDQSANALFLYDDQSQTALGPLALGSAGTLQNSQCVLYGSTSALVPGAGTDLTIDVGIGLLGSYASTPQTVYLWVQNNQFVNTGWVQTGTWNIGHTPSVVSGTPASATANPQIFTFTGRDTGGWGNIDTMYFLINTSTTAAANTCQGYYVRSKNALYLYDDAQTMAMGPLTPGTGGTLSNSQCLINGMSSSLISTSGTDLTVAVSLGRQATGPYSHGAQNVYLFVKDNEGNTTGWVQTGTWTLP